MGQWTVKRRQQLPISHSLSCKDVDMRLIKAKDTHDISISLSGFNAFILYTCFAAIIFSFSVFHDSKIGSFVKLNRWRRGIWWWDLVTFACFATTSKAFNLEEMLNPNVFQS